MTESEIEGLCEMAEDAARVLRHPAGRGSIFKVWRSSVDSRQSEQATEVVSFGAQEVRIEA
jgi:hypothetical protein